ncbi:hypothetical protein [Dyadobacter sp. CY326]|uniref:hypothetical protein n=1 Tax=Dyadobacter sp. CY326 TaxID=2907300 RepID=UPI001F16C753|nr:hypothetical protein [Dyadobacter sp. CY326]MCE7066982.1 hypothetical protein [Dyadobacter sp. CY326]
MSKTVVGIFEYESDGQNAQNYLLANGFADGNVDIKTASYKSEPDASEDKSVVDEENEGIFDRIGHFFKDLFDGDEEESNRYSEAGRRGTIVTVHAATIEEAHAAAAILDEYGAVDVNAGAGSFGTSPSSVGAESALVAEELTTSLPSVEEGLHLDRGAIGASGVRSKSRIVERPVEEHIRLRQGKVHSTRFPEDRQAPETNF